MLYYDRIDMSERIDLAKSNNSKDYLICHYWFYNYGFKFQDSLCNGCHNLTMLSNDINNIAIIYFEDVDYLCIILSISKSEDINSLKSSVIENCGYI